MKNHSKMIILGISAFFHDSSAALIIDGKLGAAVEEERFTRKKHDMGFPINAAEYCLESAGISINDVDYIGFYEKPILKFDRVLSQFLDSFPSGFSAFYKTMPSWINEKLRIRSIITKKLKYKGKVLFIEHHLAHAASSYLMSPYNESVIFTIDGVGEWATATYGFAKGNEIKIEKEIKFPHSLGLLYTAITTYCGFKANSGEYKLMGLSPYGKPTYYNQLKKLIDIKEDGSFRLNMKYFDYTKKMKMVSKRFIEEFGPPAKPEEQMNEKFKDIAASIQRLTEDILFKIMNDLHKKYNCKNLCMAGGVALNSVANGKIIKRTPFKSFFIQPAAGDGGTSVGAAAYIYFSLLKNKREYVMEHAYLGASFTNEQIKEFLDSNKINYTAFKDDKTLIEESAKLIYKDNVIGWFQGGMEFGPRALGARSILSNPTNKNMQDILNLKVKHREKFRPFAPVICEEDAKKYFECDEEIPLAADYMLLVYPVKEKWHKKIPSVTHVDGSGRLQIIRKKQNERYYNLIKEFGKLSKIPILINTSFNIRGEPIVSTPYYAYRCMMGTGIDYLIMGNHLIKRKNNPQHMWDSEIYAKGD